MTPIPSMIIPETPTEVTTPVMPFIFHYLSKASSFLPLCTDPTGGVETTYKTKLDNKEVEDSADDSDELDDGSSPQTGLLADSGTKDDEE